MSISVGSVSVDIVPDATKFRREMNAKLNNLTAPVRLTLDGKAFDAELAAATRDRHVNVDVDDRGSIQRMQGRSHALLTTLALLAPAAAPLTAVAIGAGAALTGLGGAGILAFKGIQAEMKAGTPIGKQYTTMIAGLKTNLSGLERVAARGVLTGVDGSISAIAQSMPELNREVGILSRSLGSDLEPITRGLLGLFQDLFPTTESIAGGIHNLAVDFERWATGPGGKAFAAYLAKELPIVASTLASIGAAGAHVVQALLPLGGPVLQAIQGISTVISHIPVGVVQALFLAFAGYKAITLTAAAIDAVTLATTRLGVAQGAGGVGGVGGIGKGKGAAGLGIAGMGIGGLVGAVGAGLNPDELTSPYQRAQANFQAEHPDAGAKGFQNFVKSSATDPKAAAQLKAYSSESYKAKAAQSSLGTTVAATSGDIRSNTSAVAASRAALSAWVTKLDDAFTRVSGLKSANIAVRQAVADASAALKANGRTLDLHTQKGRDNASALLAVATAEHNKIDADVAGHASQDKINADFRSGVTQLSNMAQKFGLSKGAADKYARSLLGIPRKITTTLDLQIKAIGASGLSSQAKAKAEELALSRSGSTGGYVSGDAIRRASGGPVWGAGTATSDSIPAYLSNGEYVLRASAVSQIGVSTLNELNKFASGGLVGKLAAVKGYATGGLADANIASISALLSGPTVTGANVSAAKLAEARATVALLSAESALQKLRRSGNATSRQILTAEKRIAADRIALSAATTRLMSTERAYAAGRQPLLKRFAAASSSVTRADGAFLANLNKLAARGFGFLAQQLLAQGDSDAMAEAAQAVKWGGSQLSALQRTLQTDARYQAGLAAFGSSPAQAAVNQGQGPTTIYVKLSEAGEWMLSQSDARTASTLRAQARGMTGRR